MSVDGRKRIRAGYHGWISLQSNFAPFHNVHGPRQNEAQHGPATYRLDISALFTTDPSVQAQDVVQMSGDSARYGIFLRTNP